MPKGVEHTTGTGSSQHEGAVIHSLMPKGVEHVHAPAIGSGLVRVIHSLMPKGVEHFVNRFFTKLAAV